MARTEDILRDIASDHAGLFTTKEAVDAGIARPLVVQLAARRRLERVARGLYRFPTWPANELQQYHEAVLWPQAQRDLAYAVISHDSALELYGLTQLNPAVIHVTIPLKTRIVRDTPPWIQFHRWEVKEHDRTWERGVPVVSVARAIEDIVPAHGVDVAHRAVSEARERRLLRDDELDRLAAKLGSVILEPYRAE